jgi:2-phospho-L-lactate guanylyltransferase
MDAVSDPSGPWVVVVPVKGTADGKSRLMPERTADERMRLAEAFSLDAVGALLESELVGRVIVVTDAESPVAARFRGAGPRVAVIADPGAGLNAAVTAGIAEARAGGAALVAAMLGDLPSLAARDVDEALAAASGHPLAFVPDAEGSGTTLIAATGRELVPRFGAGSAERHRRAAHVEIVPAPGSTLRHDVDTEADLRAALDRGVGPATRAVAATLSRAERATRGPSTLSPAAASTPSSRR